MDSAGRYRLSPIQEGMLFHHLSGPHSGTDVEQIIVDYHESLVPEKLEAAWRLEGDRHSALRSGFRWESGEQPLQEVHEGVALPFNLHLTAFDENSFAAFLRDDRFQGRSEER